MAKPKANTEPKATDTQPGTPVEATDTQPGTPVEATDTQPGTPVEAPEGGQDDTLTEEEEAGIVADLGVDEDGMTGEEWVEFVNNHLHDVFAMVGILKERIEKLEEQVSALKARGVGGAKRVDELGTIDGLGTTS